MNKWIDSLSARQVAPRTIRTFRWALYGFVLFNTLVLTFPIAWELHSLCMPIPFPDDPSYQVVMLLHRENSLTLLYSVMALQVLGIGLYFFRRTRIVSPFIVFISTALLFNRFLMVNTGGNYLILLMLFYLMFVNENIRAGARFQAERQVVSNLFFWACRVQVLMVYFLSGAYKLAGESWLNGKAVQIITHIDEFTLPWFKTHLAGIDWLMALADYTTLAYLCLFPVLVFIKRIKTPLLLFGMIYHLGLGIIVGVMDFSLVMIICYILFIDEPMLVKRFGLLSPSK